MNNQNNEVRVRFAPSPTGFLHIGGARTSIFNWIFARQNNGKFLLRIEDTDLVRSKEKMVQDIVNSLYWLGITWDEAPIYQSQRIKYYHKICNELISLNKAYYCYCTKVDHKLQEKKNNFDCRCRLLSKEERKKLEKRKSLKVIRFKVDEGETHFDDLIQGSLKFNNNEIDDFIILKSDGMPTYHLAVVADDQAMRISHVIRGADHISNTPKQLMLYKALGWEQPKFAHVPLILGAGKKRLSKRYGATAVEEYRIAGFYSKAVFNYLALLGWSPGNDKEIMSIQEIVDSFSLSAISKSNAIFDEKKLRWMNDQYLNNLPDEEISGIIIPLLKESKLIKSNNIDITYLNKVVHLLKPKVKLFSDFIEYGKYFFVDPEEYDEKAKDKYWNDMDVIRRLQAFLSKINAINHFNANVLETNLRGLADELDISAGKLIHPIRLALTGFSVSPGIFELMDVLGEDVVRRRIQKAINYISVNGN